MIIFNNGESNDIEQVFRNILSDKQLNDNILFIKFPYVNNVKIEFMYINTNKVYICINPIGVINTDSILDLIDEVYIHFESMFKKEKQLLFKRDLIFEIDIFAIGHTNMEEKIFNTTTDVIEHINDDFVDDIVLNIDQLSIIQSSLQGLSKISTESKVRQVEDNSLAHKYFENRKKIFTLDVEQSKCTYGYDNGPMRIRGLAGSGKTIIIAYMIANIHAKDATKKILVTFQSKSLIESMKVHITHIFDSLTNGQKIPNWNKIDILHAWGNKQYNGAYLKYCELTESDFINFNQASYNTSGNAFEYATDYTLDKCNKKIAYYDYVFVDEAQDFPNSMMKICLNLTKEKNIIWAYDELQDINEQSVSNLDNMFGFDNEGVQLITSDVIGKHDIILKKCYRSPKQILTVAHALGFGIYRDEGLVQFFENFSIFEDVGYNISSGSLNFGEKVSLERTLDTSPNTIEELNEIENFVNAISFKSNNEQLEYIKDKIIYFKDNGFENNEILIIHPEPKKSKSFLLALREYLNKFNIDSQIVAQSMGTEIDFIETGKVTLTHVHRAKGNEAPIVFAVESHLCSTITRSNAAERNKLFTEISRSMGWVYITGIGSKMEKLVSEVDKIIDNKFKLTFKVPTQKELNSIKTINQVTEKRKESMDEFVQNLNEDELELLKNIIKENEEDAHETLENLSKMSKNEN